VIEKLPYTVLMHHADIGLLRVKYYDRRAQTSRKESF